MDPYGTQVVEDKDEAHAPSDLGGSAAGSSGGDGSVCIDEGGPMRRRRNGRDLRGGGCRGEGCAGARQRCAVAELQLLVGVRRPLWFSKNSMGITVHHCSLEAKTPVCDS